MGPHRGSRPEPDTHADDRSVLRVLVNRFALQLITGMPLDRN